METTCSHPECAESVYARTLCFRHYQQARYHGTIPPSEATRRPCAHCGKPMMGRTNNRAKYCSPKCKEAARAASQKAARTVQREGRTCRQCGGPIDPSKPGKARTCSRACGVAWANAVKAEAKLATKLANRPPCAACGGPIPESLMGHARYCSPECKKKAMDARWRAKSPGYNRQYLYGMTDEQYEALLAEQDNRCAICGTSEWNGYRKSPQVDHDHDTGKVRGLLCSDCNFGLGKFKDDPDLLRAAIAYLEGVRVPS